MQISTMPRLRGSAYALLAAGVLGACDAPTAPGTAAAGGPSLLVTAACAGTGGQTHAAQHIVTAQTWTRANSPHRVTGNIDVDSGGRLIVAPGAVVCFEPATTLRAYNGGRLWARGHDTAQVVLTARDPYRGWYGIVLYGAPVGPSYLTNARVEHVHFEYTALTTAQQHDVYVDSAVIRQSGQAVRFGTAGSRLVRSRVDTTTNRILPAVDLAAGRFEQSVVRGAAGTGVSVDGPGVLLVGGRIEGSGGVGLRVAYELNPASRAVRVVGGKTHAAELPLPALTRMYSTAALQDSLGGNASDSVFVTGGILRSALTVGARLALHVRPFGIQVDSGGSLVLQPGARMVFGPDAGITAQNGGRLWSRGSAASPVRLTADDPALGWYGLGFYSFATSPSYVTNTRIDHVRLGGAAVYAPHGHPVIVDSTVIRQSGMGIHLAAQNSRLSRTRVDTTLDARFPAVYLAGNTRMESTRIRASAGPGLAIWSPYVVVASCEIRDGDQDGILMEYYVVPVHNCNLVNNAGAGIRRNPGGAGGAVDVTGNWWGSADGPMGPGGDGVSGTLVYSPWRTTPFVLPYVP